MSILHRIISRIKSILQISKKAIELFPNGEFINISPDLIVGKYINLNISTSHVIINIGEKVLMREFCNVFVEAGAELKISKNVFFNNYCSINCFHRIYIGENVLFGEGVKLYDHNHIYSNSPIKVEPHEFRKAPIIIGDNCWIGSNVTILKGVTIGDNVIIGANNLIYKSIPSDVIVKNKAELIMEKCNNLQKRD